MIFHSITTANKIIAHSTDIIHMEPESINSYLNVIAFPLHIILCELISQTLSCKQVELVKYVVTPCHSIRYFGFQFRCHQ